MNARLTAFRGIVLLFVAVLFVSSPECLAGSRTPYGIYSLGEDELADDARAAGMSYVIRQFAWSQIEPEQDLFNFGLIENWYHNSLEPNDMFAVVNLRTRQCWATNNASRSILGMPIPSSASAPPLDYDDYYDLVFRLVDHFAGTIDHFIIENDPLTRYEWYGTPEEYKQLVAVAYEAAKAANPHCVIIGNKFPAMALPYLITRDMIDGGKAEEAVAFWNGYQARRNDHFQVNSLEELLGFLNSSFGNWCIPFSDAIMTPDHAANLDVIGYNYYMHYEYIDEIVGWLRWKMEKNGFELPLVDLEHGVKDERDEVPDVTAAQELVKGYLITSMLGIPSMAWYPFTLDTVSHNFENLKLMYDYHGGEFLPPYYAMKTLSRHLTARHVFQAADTVGWFRYSFMNAATGLTDIDVVWSDGADSVVTLPFRSGFAGAVVTNYLGNAPDTMWWTSGSVPVEAGPAPKFIRWLGYSPAPHADPIGVPFTSPGRRGGRPTPAARSPVSP